MGDRTRSDPVFPRVARPARLVRAAGMVAVVCAAHVTADTALAQRTGQVVAETACVRCHGTGAQGAPRIGDRHAWSARASQGLTSLTEHAITGIRQMPAHGGSPDVSDLEIARAITYMVNRSGGAWVEPATARDLMAERSGAQVVATHCSMCHESGEGGAPRIGDWNAWTPRLKQGLDYLVRSAIRGHGGMPARGGMADATDAEISRAIAYMFNPGGAVASEARKPGVAPARAEGRRLTVSGMDVYLGLVPAETLRAYPKEAVERSMHGGVPAGPGRYHVNVSLFDAGSGAAITDAQVEVRIDKGGIASESKKLEPMVINNATSYGNYVSMRGPAAYVVTILVRRPDRPGQVEARFDHRSGN